MRLQRVQIPNFRVLKDIDITFEEYHTPQIFPLASQNGGGKSTFLHLVFTLLISCINGDRSELIENLLKNSGVDWFSGNSKLSTITLTDNKNTIEIDFAFYTINTFCHLFLFELEGEKYRNQLAKLKELGIDGYNNLYDQIKIDIQILAEENQSQEFDVNSLLKKIMIENSFSSKETEGSIALDFFAVTAILAKYPEVFQAAQLSKNTKGLMENLQASEKQRKTKTIINNRKKKLHDLEVIADEIGDFLSEFNRILLSKGITIFSNQNNVVLTSKVINSEGLDYTDISKKVFNKIFMSASSSQVFLFLSPEELSSLFREPSDYHEILRAKQKVINNLFLYDFSMVELLTGAFKKALDNDRMKAIRSGGNHGNEFKILFDDLKDFLNSKIIQPSEDMSKIVIKQQDDNDQEVALSPVDLSHGELRRLSFYAWLKTNEIKNSIVLVDEIEIGLHPDWQYQIVRDLEKWEPSNQYILATHSYEVCSALSPAHVKEIEPKLLKSEIKAAQ